MGSLTINTLPQINQSFLQPLQVRFGKLLCSMHKLKNTNFKWGLGMGYDLMCVYIYPKSLN